MAKKAKTSARRRTTSRTLITDTFRITVLSKKNPFKEGTIQYDKGQKVLASKTVADAKKKGVDAWAVREMVKRKVIAVKAVA